MTREEQAKRREQMRQYKAEGHSIGEVAEQFGVSRGLAKQTCKGIAPQTQRRPKHPQNQWTKGTGRAKQFDKVLRIIEERAPGFEYAGNYTGSDGTVDLKCKTCGRISTKAWITVKHGQNRAVVTCELCLEDEVRERREAREQAKWERMDAQRRAAEISAWMRRTQNAKQVEMKICPCCGIMFYGTRKYCGDICAKRVENAATKDKRIRKLKGINVDRGITLKRLAERDRNTCALCGTEVDWTDYEETGGIFIAGNNYPSIDHIVPISKGGLHAWENVQLAHKWCNTKKSNIPPGLAI